MPKNTDFYCVQIPIYFRCTFDCPKCSRSSSKSGVTVFDMFIIPSTFFHCVQKSPVTICSVSEKCDQITLIYCIAKLPPQKIQGIIKSRYIA